MELNTRQKEQEYASLKQSIAPTGGLFGAQNNLFDCFGGGMIESQN